MARKREKVTVDNIVYDVGTLPPTTATLMLLKMLKIFAPALGKAFSGKSTASLLKVKDAALTLKDMNLEEVLTIIADRLDEEKIMEMARTLLSNTFPVGKPQMLLGIEGNFDIHFEDVPGGQLHLIMVLKEVIQLQYADFFGAKGIQDNLEEITQPIESPSLP